MRSKLWVYVLVLFLTFGANATDNSTSNQTNTSGSNTSISGGYTSTTNNTYSGGQTNTTTNSTTNSTKNSKIPVGTATAPSMSSYSQGVSGGVQVTGFGVSGGTYVTDENCERMKLSKLLYDFNMRVASIAILCQDDRVFSAMEHAGTPCPFEGKIGKDATDQWKKYDVERPDYDQYIQKLKRRNAIDNKTEFVPVDSEYDLYGDDN